MDTKNKNEYVQIPFKGMGGNRDIWNKAIKILKESGEFEEIDSQGNSLTIIDSDEGNFQEQETTSESDAEGDTTTSTTDSEEENTSDESQTEETESEEATEEEESATEVEDDNDTTEDEDDTTDLTV